MKLAYLMIFILCSTALFADQTKIEQILEPVVQVKLRSLVPSGASGTIIYSKNKNTFVLTNFHVIDTAIRKKGTEDERRIPVNIEMRKFLDGGRKIRKFTKTGHVVAHDDAKDLALIWIKDFETDQVAKLLPEGQQIELFQKVWSVGNPELKGFTYFTVGEVTMLNVLTPTGLYGYKAELFTATAQVHYGFSGGATFTQSGENYYLVGVPHALHQFRGQPVGWLAYMISLNTMRDFFSEQDLCFLEMDLPVPEFKIYPEPEPLKIKLDIESLQEFFNPFGPIPQNN